MTNRPRGLDTIPMFSNSTQTHLRRKSSCLDSASSQSASFAQCLWPTGHVTYKSFLFFELLLSSSSGASLSQPEFLLGGWLHRSGSPSLTARVSLRWLGSPAWSPFLGSVAVSVLTAGGSQAPGGLWLLPGAVGGSTRLPRAWGLPGKPGSPEGGGPAGHWGLDGCGSLRHLAGASGLRPSLLSSRGSRSLSLAGGLSGSFAAAVTAASLESEGVWHREVKDVLASSASGLLPGKPPGDLGTSGDVVGG